VDPTSVLNKVNIPNDWKIARPTITNTTTTYPTSFGDPREASYTATTVVIGYNLERRSIAIFFKLFIALFISLLIAISSLLIKKENSEARYGLIVGGLFGSISNKYVTDNLLPETAILNLSDKIHFLTILYLFLIIILSIIENRFALRRKPLYYILIPSLLITYIIAVWIFIK
jgi:hypothetical protein